MESVWRSPATVCLNDYLKHLAVFSPEAVVAITADWKASFRALRAGVVDSQARGGQPGEGGWVRRACVPAAMLANRSCRTRAQPMPPLRSSPIRHPPPRLCRWTCCSA